VSSRFAVLVRAVNVGGHNRLPMAQFRDLLADLGYRDVATLLQSGNAVVSTGSHDATTVAAAVESGLSERLGLRVTVVVRTATQLQQALAGVPYADAEDTYLAFLARTPDADFAAAFDTSRFAPDEARLGDGVVYLRYPGGAGRTRLTNDVVERLLGVSATSRNWRTTSRVLAALSS
jgi:uncharacterized protein (DUF1697 family)